MIRRDQYGIICQYDIYNNVLDGGDSSNRTGIMALAGSQQDKLLLPLFITSSSDLVRHPFQQNAKDPALTSRDQLIPFVSSKDPSVHNLALKYAKRWFINKDFLSADVKMYLYRAAGLDAPLLLKIIAYPLLLVSILWNAYVQSKHEQNQFICQCIGTGSRWIKLLYKLHPSLEANVLEYWSGWRDQQEIAEAFIQKMRQERDK